MKNHLIIGALTLAAVGIIAFKRHEPSIAGPSSPAGLEKYEEATRLKISEALKVEGVHVIPAPAPLDIDAYVREEGEKFKGSMAELGYDLGRPSDYESYSEEALTKMSTAGDGKASMVLLKRNTKEPTDVNEKLWNMALEAAANGQIAALGNLSAWEKFKVVDKSDASKEHMLYALSYAYAAEELGDVGRMDADIIWSRIFELQLNENDFARIIRDGKKVIAELDQNRAARGLGSLDRNAIWKAEYASNTAIIKGWTPEAKKFYAFELTAK